MTERLAVDTNAVVDYLRESRLAPPLPLTAREVLLPLTVLGELFAGAFASDRVSENLSTIERLGTMWPLLVSDAETARVYGRIRAESHRRRSTLPERTRNDFWIAAVCIQHNLPLLTNVKTFDEIGGLEVVHW